MAAPHLPLQADKVQLRTYEDGFRVCLGLGSYSCPYDFRTAMLIAVSYAHQYGIAEVEICDYFGGVERTISLG